MNLPGENLKVVIADDEPAARKSIEILLSKIPGIEVLKVCADGKETVEAISDTKPDLVFLDIQMPEMSGFQVLEKINGIHNPVFIFVTAYEEFAIKAFEKSAVDYLMKPYDDERFYQSLEKAKKMISANKIYDQAKHIETLISTLNASTSSHVKNFSKKLIIKTNGKISFVTVNSIKFIESEGNFVKIHVENNFKIGNYTFKELSLLLDPKTFVRIHKSYMVNIDFIESIEPHFHGDYLIGLKDGNKLKLSRNYKECLDQILYN